ATGDYRFTMTVKDATGVEISKDFNITITDLKINSLAPTSGAVTIPYSHEFTATGGSDIIYTWSIVAGVLPAGVSLNPNTGVISGTPSSSGTSTFIVQVQDSQANASTEIYSITISDLNIFTDSVLPVASNGVSYKDVKIEVEGGTAPYSWLIDNPGSLPANLIFNGVANNNSSSAPITGIVNASEGTYKFTITVYDSSLILNVSKTFTLTVQELQITTTTLSDGALEIPYVGQTLVASGGRKPYLWSVIAGQMPGGLLLGAYTGRIDGTPSSLGETFFVVQVEDADGKKQSKTLSINISNMNILTDAVLPVAISNSFYATDIEVEGGSAPYTWWMDSISNGIINGIDVEFINSSATSSIAIVNASIINASAQGTYPFTIYVKDSTDLSINKDFTLQVQNLNIVTQELSDGARNVEYSQLLTGSGGAEPYSWSVVAGQLPLGLTLNSNTGRVEGTPANIGETSFIVELRDYKDRTKEQLFYIDISNLFIKTDSVLPVAINGASYAEKIEAEGGTAPYSWWVDSGSYSTINGIGVDLINSASGAIVNASSIANTAEGSYPFTVYIEDSTNLRVNKDFTLKVQNLRIIDPTGGTAFDPTSGAIQLGGAVDEPYSQQLTASGGDYIYTWSIIAGSLPTGLLLNPVTGRIEGIPTNLGSSFFIVQVEDSAGLSVTEFFSIEIADMVIKTDTVLETAINNAPLYNVDITVEGGNAPYTWSLDQGTLPNGLALNTSINLETTEIYNSGDVDTDGTRTFTIKVTDDSSPTKLSVTKEFSIRVQSLNITTLKALAGGAVGIEYSQPLDPDGGSGIYDWSVSLGSLPPGLSLSPLSGYIEGTPTSLGTYTFEVKLLDLDDDSEFRKIFTMKVAELKIVSENDDLGVGVTNSPYSYTFQAEGGTAPYTWSIIDNTTVPPGLSISNAYTGLFNGTPSDKNTYSFIVNVSDSTTPDPFSITKAFTFKVQDLSLTASAALSAAAQDELYYTTIDATGGSNLYEFTITAGSLPEGIVLISGSGGTATITGTPVNLGRYAFELTVTDSDGNTQSEVYTLEVAKLSITNDDVLPVGVHNTTSDYEELFVAVGSSGYIWSIEAGLADLNKLGLTFYNAGGSEGKIINVTTGSLNTGSANFQIKVTDGAVSVTKDFSIVVTDLRITSLAPTSGAVNIAYSHEFTATSGEPDEIFTWSIVAGVLPDGISLNVNTGYLTGTPSAQGTATFIVQVQDSKGNVSNKTYPITISDMNIFTDSVLPVASNGVSYDNVKIEVEGGTAPYSWLIDNPTNLPSSLLFDALATSGSSAPITGNVDVGALLGTYKFTVTVYDSSLVLNVSKTFILTVQDLQISTTTLSDGAQDIQYVGETLVASGGSKPYQWSIIAGQLPLGLSLGAFTGRIEGTPSNIGETFFVVQVEDADGKKQVATLNINISNMNILTSETLPIAINGIDYSTYIEVEGGSAPYTWWMDSISNGIINGIDVEFINSAGTIAEIRAVEVLDTAKGTYPFTIYIKDSSDLSINKDFTLQVQDLSITTPSLSDGAKDVEYSRLLEGTGGKKPYTWSILAGLLPEGLTLNPTTGRIEGIPTKIGETHFIVELRDYNDRTIEELFSIDISNLFIKTDSTLPVAINGTGYNEKIEAEGGSAPYTWWMDSISNGIINGIDVNFINSGTSATLNASKIQNTAEGSFPFTVYVSDSTGLEVAKDFTLKVQNLDILTFSNPDPVTDAYQLGGGAVDVAYSQQMTAKGGDYIYSWSIIAGYLPTGLILNPITGRIEGTPTSLGTTYFRVQVEDSTGLSVSKLFTIEIADMVIVTETVLPFAVISTAYDESVQVEGGTPPYTWSVDPSTSLPLGLNLTSAPLTNSIGNITGIPSNAGNVNFELIVYDSSTPTPLRVTKEFSIRVQSLDILTPQSLVGGSVGTQYSTPLVPFGGSGIYDWSVSLGTLPPGLTLNPQSGYIEGTPSNVGPYSFEVTLLDLKNNAVNVKQFDILISQINITTVDADLGVGIIANMYSHVFKVEGGAIPYTWSVIDPTTLPAATPGPYLVMDPDTGLLNGLVDSAADGTYFFTVKVEDDNAASITKDFTLKVQNLSLPAGAPLAAAAKDVAYENVINANGGSGIFNFTITAGTLPAGLILTSGSGGTATFTGTPTALGLYAFELTVTDSAGATQSEVYSLRVSDLSIVNDAEMPVAVVGAVYSVPLSAVGGTSPYTWSIPSGDNSLWALNLDFDIPTNTVIDTAPPVKGDAKF
ncbi:putative Ig domain-containing protein, partial [Nitrospirota bacterium]